MSLASPPASPLAAQLVAIRCRAATIVTFAPEPTRDAGPGGAADPVW